MTPIRGTCSRVPSCFYLFFFFLQSRCEFNETLGRIGPFVSSNAQNDRPLISVANVIVFSSRSRSECDAEKVQSIKHFWVGRRANGHRSTR